MNLAQQLPLCSLKMIRWSFHMLVILAWYVFNPSVVFVSSAFVAHLSNAIK